METIILSDFNNDRDCVVLDEIGKRSIKLYRIIKKSSWKTDKSAIRKFIINYYYVNNIRDIETIDIYLTLMKLNLKRKKYTFSEYCIDNLEDSIKTYDKILQKNTLYFMYNDHYCFDYICRFFN